MIYRHHETTFRDLGDKIIVSRGEPDLGIAAALLEAFAQFGINIMLHGDDTFKNKAYAAQRFLGIDINMQEAETRLNSITGLEENNDDNRHIKPRRTNRSSIETIGRTRADGKHGTRDNVLTNKLNRTRAKPNIGSIGRSPPPTAKDRLRNLSELSVARFTNRGEVLLQGNVSRELVHERTQPNHPVRWYTPESGVNNAADSYINEREEKRQRIPDILRHRRFQPTDAGQLVFLGLRQVNNEYLLLLKRHDEILVLPISRLEFTRLEKSTRGLILKVCANGKVKLGARKRGTN